LQSLKRLKKLTKSLKTKTLKKAVVLGVQYAALCHNAFVEHLHDKVTQVTEMQHGRRKMLIEEQGLLAKIKIGDWVFAIEDMSPGMNSEGGTVASSRAITERKLATSNPFLQALTCIGLFQMNLSAMSN
jgi:hypothetical protein